MLILLLIWTLSVFMLWHPTSSFAAVIICTSTRGHCITILQFFLWGWAKSKSIKLQKFEKSIEFVCKWWTWVNVCSYRMWWSWAHVFCLQFYEMETESRFYQSRQQNFFHKPQHAEDFCRRACSLSFWWNMKILGTLLHVLATCVLSFFLQVFQVQMRLSMPLKQLLKWTEWVHAGVCLFMFICVCESERDEVDSCSSCSQSSSSCRWLLW